MPGDCEEIRAECADRLARLETNVNDVIKNDLKHLAADIKGIRGAIFKVIMTLLGITGAALLGLLIALIKGHFQF